jgi:hypothetical protein
MNPRIYEKLFGLRVPIVLTLFVLVVIIIFLLFGRPLKASPSPKSTQVTGNATNELPGNTNIPIDITPTGLQPTPTQGVNLLPSPTALINVTKEPIPAPTNPPLPTAIPVIPTLTTSPTNNILFVCTGYTNGLLNFHAGPTVQSRIISVLQEGTQVLFLERADTVYPWMLVEVNGIQGYAYGGYLCEAGK